MSNGKSRITNADLRLLNSVRRGPVRPIVVTKNGKMNGNGTSDLGVVLQNFVNYLKAALTNGQFLVSFAIVTYFMFSYLHNKDNFISATVTKLVASKDFSSIGTWLKTNLVRALGFLAFIPAIVNVPINRQAITAVIAFLWVWFVPEHNPYEYILQGLLLYLFLKTRSDKFRIVIFLIAAFLYFFQYVFTFHELACKDITNLKLCIRNCKHNEKVCVDNSVGFPAEGEVG